jgi:transposase
VRANRTNPCVPVRWTRLNADHKPRQGRQIVFQQTDLEQLIPADHLARAIWQVVCGLDLSAFEAGFRSRVELQGAPRWDPRVLITALVYGYATGVGSGRALEWMMLWEPALRWLTADQEINYHTLTSFRTAHEEKLKDLFAQLLVTLEGEGLVEFKTLIQDGTKVRARASRSSFHRAASIHRHFTASRAMGYWLSPGRANSSSTPCRRKLPISNRLQF